MLDLGWLVGGRRARGFVLLLAAAAAGCIDARPQQGTVLVVGRATDATVLDPALVTDNESIEVTEQIFDHLLRYNEATTEVEPALATRWTVSEDRRHFTFELRPNVFFHDGTVFDAEAAVFSFMRQKDSTHPFHFPEVKYEYWDSVYRNVQDVEALGPLRLRITLDQPYAPFLQNLAMSPVSIVSPTAVKKYGRDFGRRPVGTGPFQFGEWVRGERITLRRFDRYWGQKPELSRLVFRVLPEARERLNALEGGAVDVVYNLAPSDLKYVQLHPDLIVHRAPGMNVAYLAMNMLKPPFDNRTVRLAVAHAINKSSIVKLIYQGYAVPAVTPLPPNQWGHHDKLADYAWDPEQAARLMVEADVKPFTARLYVMNSPKPYLPRPERVARAVAAQLRAIGATIEVDARPFTAYTGAVERGEHDLCVGGWNSDNGDPDNFLYPMLDRDNAVLGKALNRAFYRSADLHGMLVWGREAIDRSERSGYYRKAQEIVHRDLPWVPLAHADVIVASRSDVTGLVVHPSAHIHYGGVGRRVR